MNQKPEKITKSHKEMFPSRIMTKYEHAALPQNFPA